MMLALVVVAGSAMAQTSIAPYPLATYHYSITGIQVGETSQLTVTYDQAGSISSTLPTSVNIDAGTTVYNFDITWGASPVAGTLTATIVDGTCGNSIPLTITPASAPTIALTIASTSPSCWDGTNNTFTYTIDPTIANTSSYAYSWTANFGIAGNAYNGADLTATATGGNISGNVNDGYTITSTTADNVVITVTYVGGYGVAGASFVGTIQPATLSISTAELTGSWAETGAAEAATSTILHTPRIGGFVGL